MTKKITIIAICILILFSIFSTGCNITTNSLASIAFQKERSLHEFYFYNSWIDHMYGHNGTYHSISIDCSSMKEDLSGDHYSPEFRIRINISDQVNKDYAEGWPTPPIKNKDYPAYISYYDNANNEWYTGEGTATIHYNSGSFGPVGGVISSIQLVSENPNSANITLEEIKFDVHLERDKVGIE